MANAVRRDSMENTARPSLWARMDRAFPFPCFFVISARSCVPPGAWRKKRTAASEDAHFKWTLPIFAPPLPRVLPADVGAHFTSRAKEANACTRSNRGMS